MRRRHLLFPTIAAAALAGCADQPTGPGIAPSASRLGTPESYIVIGNGDRLPADFEAQVRAAGGTVVESHPEIGVAIAQSDAPGFGARLARNGGIESVTFDEQIQWIEPMGVDAGAAEVAAEAPAPDAAGTPDASAAATSLGDLEPLYFLQWAPKSIDAPAAWNAGFTGRGARVAILDGALHSSHVDLAPNLDVAASRSFVPGFAYNQDVGTFWHGTHVAGIVGAAANRIGTIGIAPEATLIGVKVLHNGSGAFSWILNGIMHAATPVAQGGAGAHIINMSLGATLDEKLKVQKADVRELRKAYDRATRYAYQQGVTVIASAGNGATNFDVANTLYKIPAQNQHVISISSTGPVAWARGSTNFAQPAYYTDHGKALVSLSAPGGNFALAAVGGDFSNCAVGGLTRACYVFDGVLASVRGSSTGGAYNWAQGTSMAAPTVAGVAALIVEKLGPGNAHPAQVRALLQQSASDLGDPGNDVWYGMGWVNAGRAVR